MPPVGHPSGAHEIITACISLARDGGEAAVTMRAVARQCGMSPTELYRYFDGKKDILHALQVHAAETLASSLTSPDDDATMPPMQQLRQICGRYVEFAQEQRWLYTIAFRDADRPGVAVSGVAAAAFFEAVVPVLRRMTTPTRGMNVRAIAQRLWAAAHGITFVSPAETKPYLDAVVPALVR